MEQNMEPLQVALRYAEYVWDRTLFHQKVKVLHGLKLAAKSLPEQNRDSVHEWVIQELSTLAKEFDRKDDIQAHARYQKSRLDNQLAFLEPVFYIDPTEPEIVLMVQRYYDTQREAYHIGSTMTVQDLRGARDYGERSYYDDSLVDQMPKNLFKEIEAELLHKINSLRPDMFKERNWMNDKVAEIMNLSKNGRSKKNTDWLYIQSLLGCPGVYTEIEGDVKNLSRLKPDEFDELFLILGIDPGKEWEKEKKDILASDNLSFAMHRISKNDGEEVSGGLDAMAIDSGGNHQQGSKKRKATNNMDFSILNQNRLPEAPGPNPDHGGVELGSSSHNPDPGPFFESPMFRQSSYHASSSFPQSLPLPSSTTIAAATTKPSDTNGGANPPAGNTHGSNHSGESMDAEPAGDGNDKGSSGGRNDASGGQGDTGEEDEQNYQGQGGGSSGSRRSRGGGGGQIPITSTAPASAAVVGSTSTTISNRVQGSRVQGHGRGGNAGAAASQPSSAGNPSAGPQIPASQGTTATIGPRSAWVKAPLPVGGPTRANCNKISTTEAEWECNIRAEGNQHLQPNGKWLHDRGNPPWLDRANDQWMADDDWINKYHAADSTHKGSTQHTIPQRQLRRRDGVTRRAALKRLVKDKTLPDPYYDYAQDW